jgi:NADPH:quinone reductase-like Zn-dependent oxidoreductase
MATQTHEKPTMFAIVTTGNGGYEQLEPQQVPMPEPATDEVLIRVLAAGVNNTEINTRLGWYSSKVVDGTDATTVDQNTAPEEKSDGGWNAATPFPLIQGTDCCGEVVTGDPALLGRRVIVRACMRPHGFGSQENIWMASDFDGTFAQYVKVPASEAFAVDCDWSNAELATIPCAYGTAETMLGRARVRAGDWVLVTGASGGVGSAAVQLAKRRGASVVAIAGRAKMDQVRAIGADEVHERGADLVSALGESCVDVVIDNVAGVGFGQMLKLLKRGGRYASSGAIAGPVVSLDMRDMYLKDITLFGSTAWDEPVFPNLISYIERGEIRPLLAKTFDLADIAQAQEEFLEKAHFGNFVLIPPAVIA